MESRLQGGEVVAACFDYWLCPAYGSVSSVRCSVWQSRQFVRYGYNKNSCKWSSRETPCD